jgi:hypothetical protein
MGYGYTVVGFFLGFFDHEPGTVSGGNGSYGIVSEYFLDLSMAPGSLRLC